MYKVSKHIDYISCTVSSFVTADDTFGRWHDVQPRQRNYDRAKEFDIGVFVQWHTQRPLMRINIILTGETLARLRDAGFTDYDILHWLKSMPQARFTRIDICITSAKIDGTRHGLTPHAIHYFAQNGLCETRLKIDKPVTNPELIVETAYIGSRKARNRVFRAYDKGLELGGAADKIIRYELETRKNASHIADEIHKKRTDIAALIRRYVDFPRIEEWIEIMSTEVAGNWRVDNYETETEKNEKRWNWLMTSVAPAMAKALYHDDVDVADNKNADKFAARVAALYNKLIDNATN